MPRKSAIEQKHSNSLNADVRYLQAQTVWARSVSTVLTNAGISASAYALIFFREGTGPEGIYWLALIYLSLLFRFGISRYIQRVDLNRKNPQLSLSLITVGSCSSGVAWGTLPFILPHFNAFSLDAGLYLMMLGISIGSVLLGVGYRWVSVAFSTPIHLAVIVSVVSTGGISGIIVALNVVVLTMILHRSCQNSERSFLESITRKLEATALATSLTAAHSEMLQANARLELLASCDPLTGLANRSAFNSTLANAIQEARDSKGKIGLLVVDLDRFKHVNDTMGHKAGDTLLTEFAQRLRNSLPPSNTFIARLGGDEFAIIVTGNDAVLEATRSADIILHQVRKPFFLSGQNCSIGTSVGLAIYPDHATQADELFVSADMALYRSKEQGRGRWRKFDPKLRIAADRQRQIEADILEAIEKHKIEAWFQPQVCLQRNIILGFEALVRWHHPTLGFIAPPEIVQAAYSIQASDRLTGAIADAACAMLKRLPELGLPEATVAINVSPREFALYSVSEMLDAKVKQHGIKPSLLEIEITEEALLDTVIAGEQLKQLERSGFALAVDDFGAGHSSLTRLIDLKVDRLKIDRGITTGIAASPRNQAIISALIRLGEALSMTILAEGVETEEESRTLRSLGCKIGQGYLFSRPMNARALEEWLRNPRARSLPKAAVA
ncbi:EAL domain-containing protein [Rhizobium lemnae]|uniref:Bifunctional diguanylate cyclase/phosphodiesterase n=1 Tax=Rhizobium lemnae TaxID=1214924 RepID=A0ABV8EAX2_9HYPH|nr:EAL domain-containing protein [Rhizobium lemnae]MCJ8506806.1 EAL domain-containing protein [Rhizobium lemnae]